MPRKDSIGALRIIGGEWRGRKIPVADLPGLRPTTDRIRETLFNWLAPEIHGRHCLDLFAGTGALGLEALSRGAASCCFVEVDRVASRLLTESLQRLGAADRSAVQTESAATFLARTPAQTYDLVFLDPPFASEFLAPSARDLVTHHHLGEDALVYVEYAAGADPALPAELVPWRSKRAGKVVYELYHLP